MKKIGIVTLIAITLCLVLAFTACTPTPASKVFDAKKFDTSVNTKVLTQAVKVTELDGYSLNNRANGLMLFSKINGTKNEYIVYDAVAERVVKTYSEDTNVKYAITLQSVNFVDGVFYVLRTRTGATEAEYSYKYELIAANGETVAEQTTDYVIDNVINVRSDVILFDNTLYRIGGDNKIGKIKELNDLTGVIPNFDSKRNGCYYDFDGDKFTVYDEDFDVIYYYEAPNYATNPNFNVLDNGNVLTTYSIPKMDTDNKYVYIQVQNNAAKKYDLRQLVINPKKGKISQLENKYYIAFASSRYEDDGEDAFNGLNKKYVNVACIYPIEDGYLKNNNSDSIIVSIGNDGLPGDILNATIEGEQGFECISKDRVIINDFFGNSYLCNYKGKVIGKVTNKIGYNETFVIGAENVYDMDLKVVCAYAKAGYDYEFCLGNSVVLSKEVDGKVQYKRLTADGVLHELCDDSANFTRQSAYYSVRKNTGKYELYNYNSDLIWTAESPISVYADTWGARQYGLVKVNESGSNVYYILH